MPREPRIPTDRQVAAIAGLYEDGQKRLERLVREALERGAEGTAAFRKSQLAAVRRLLSELQDRAVPTAAETTAAAYTGGAAAAEAALAARPVVAWSGVHQAAVDVLADNMVNRLNDAAVTVGRRTEDAFRRAGLRQTAAGLVEGATRKEVSAQLERKIVEDAISDALTGFVDKRGRRIPLDTYARMVARTTTREAVTAGTVNRLNERGHDLVTITSHANPCDICKRYDGRTYSLSGRSRNYPPLSEAPPFHPNCRHVLTPAAANFEEFERALGLAA